MTTRLDLDAGAGASPVATTTTTTTTTTETVMQQEDATARAVVWLLRYLAANGSTVPLDVLRADSTAAGHSHTAARAALRMLGRCHASAGGSWTFTLDPSWAARGPHTDHTDRISRAVAGIDGRALDRMSGGHS